MCRDGSTWHRPDRQGLAQQLVSMSSVLEYAELFYSSTGHGLTALILHLLRMIIITMVQSSVRKSVSMHYLIIRATDSCISTGL